MVNLHCVETSDETADSAGKIPKELKDTAFKMTEAAMILKFYTNLIKEGVGTRGVENKAYSLLLERKSKEGRAIDPGETVIEGRDPEMVVDQLKLKVKYAEPALRGQI